MVHTGVYEKDEQIGYSQIEEDRNIGDTWSDEFYEYEKMDGFISKRSKNSKTLQKVRQFLDKSKMCQNDKCETIGYGVADKSLIQKTGYCVNCLEKRESELKVAGVYDAYQNYIIWNNMLKVGTYRIAELEQAILDVKQVHEFINDDGSTESWEMPQSVEEVKSDMREMIIDGNLEIHNLKIEIADAYQLLKDKNYESYV